MNSALTGSQGSGGTWPQPYPPYSPNIPYPNPPYQPSPVTIPTVTTVYPWKEIGVSDFELNKMGEIVEAIAKARQCFDSLDDETHKRVLAFLEARFGVKEMSLIDVLVEES